MGNSAENMKEIKAYNMIKTAKDWWTTLARVVRKVLSEEVTLS